MCERVITLDIYACHNVGNIDVAEKNCDFIYNVIHVEFMTSGKCIGFMCTLSTCKRELNTIHNRETKWFILM